MHPCGAFFILNLWKLRFELWGKEFDEEEQARQKYRRSCDDEAASLNEPIDCLSAIKIKNAPLWCFFLLKKTTVIFGIFSFIVIFGLDPKIQVNYKALFSPGFPIRSGMTERERWPEHDSRKKCPSMTVEKKCPSMTVEKKCPSMTKKEKRFFTAFRIVDDNNNDNL